MGSSVADVTRSLGTKAVHRLAESTVDPRELLWGILHTLSQIRGSPSYLFPSLLERCKSVLGLDCTLTIGNFLPALGAHTPDHGSTWANNGEQGWDLLAACRDLHVIREVEGDQNEPVPAHLSGVGPGSEMGYQDCLLS
jgi:hypothetical protein